MQIAREGQSEAVRKSAGQQPRTTGPVAAIDAAALSVSNNTTQQFQLLQRSGLADHSRQLVLLGVDYA